MDLSLVAYLLDKLFLNHTDVTKIVLPVFLRFAASLSTADQKEEFIFPRLMSGLELSTLEKCFLVAIRKGSNLEPASVFKIFGDVFSDPRKIRLIENNLYLRGLKNEDEMKNVFTYLKLMNETVLGDLMSKAFQLFLDE